MTVGSSGCEISEHFSFLVFLLSAGVEVEEPEQL